MRRNLRQTSVAMSCFAGAILAVDLPLWSLSAPWAWSAAVSLPLTFLMWPAVVEERPVSAGRGAAIGGLIGALAQIITLAAVFFRESGGLGKLLLGTIMTLGLPIALLGLGAGATIGGILAARAKASLRIAASTADLNTEGPVR